MAQERQILFHEFQRTKFRGGFHIARADGAQERRGQDSARRGPFMNGIGNERRRKLLVE